MADVAKAAGVSISTVSKVVNGRDGISGQTTERVREAIGLLGFDASLGARSLHGSQTHVIGVLARELQEIDASLLTGISSTLSRTNYDMLVFDGKSVSSAHGWEMRSLTRLGSLIDGALILEPTGPINCGDRPVIMVDPDVHCSIPTVAIDDAHLGALAAEYLLGLGHRHVAVATDSSRGRRARLREQGFRRAMSAYGTPVSSAHVVDVGSADGPVAVARILADANAPTAFFSSADEWASKVMAMVGAVGLRVPEDVSVLGSGDDPGVLTTRHSLSTVTHSRRETGAMAARSLIDLLEGRPFDPHAETQSAAVVPRGSTVAPVG